MRGAFIFLAYKDLLSHKKLILLVVLTLTIGIVNTNLTVGLLKGLEKITISDVVDTLLGHVSVRPLEGEDYIRDPEAVKDKAESLPQVKDAQLRPIFTGRVEAVVPRAVEPAFELPVEFGEVIMALDLEEREQVYETKLKEGSFLSGESGECMLGHYLAENVLGVDVGDSVRITFPNGAKRECKVVGLVRLGTDEDYYTAFIPLEDLKAVMGESAINMVYITLHDKKDAENVKAALLQEGVRARILTWEEQMEYIDTLLSMLSAILFIISGISIVAASASIGVLIYINVLGRTREIGTLKAVGATPLGIMMIYVGQALLLGIAGIITGIGISIGIISYINAQNIYIGELTRLVLFADPFILFMSALVTLLFVFLAGIYPAKKASELEVVDALRYE